MKLLKWILLIGIFLHLAFVFGENGWRYSGDLSSSSMSSDGKYIVVTTAEDKIFSRNRTCSYYYIDMMDKNGSVLWSHRIDYYSSSIYITNDNKYILTCCYNNIYLFDNTGTLLWKYHSKYKHISAASITSDGRYILIEENNTLKVFNNKGHLYGIRV